MKRTHRWLCATLVLLALSGCSNSISLAGGETVEQGLEGSQWRLIEVAGAAVVPSAGERQPFIALSEASTQATGFAGCNNFFGSYLLKGEELTFGPLGATRMACPEPESVLEADFLTALEASRRWQIEEGVLLLLDEGGRVIARFTR